MSEKRERLFSGLVTVNEDNINHFKCCFGAYETEMKHNMKCSFISEGFILLTFNHLILIALFIKFEGKNTTFSISKILFWMMHITVSFSYRCRVRGCRQSQDRHWGPCGQGSFKGGLLQCSPGSSAPLIRLTLPGYRMLRLEAQCRPSLATRLLMSYLNFRSPGFIICKLGQTTPTLRDLCWENETTPAHVIPSLSLPEKEGNCSGHDDS